MKLFFLLKVLYLEQLLTTGGGWQDQIGGLMGGVQLGLSEAVLPLYVEPLDLKLSEARLKDFDSRLLLIYTGKTRLARNLLQVSIISKMFQGNFFLNGLLFVTSLFDDMSFELQLLIQKAVHILKKYITIFFVQ